MGDGAARHRSALCGTEPCRVMTHHNKSLIFKTFFLQFSVNTFATAPPTFAPTSTFAPLFSGYPLSAANLTGNPFSTNSLTGSMFKQ